MHRIVTGLALAAGLAATSIASANAQQYGGYGPPGSYQQSCVNVQMRGSTLSASCTSNSGQHVYSSLNVNGCNGDIANSNGRLTCNGNYGYNGYGNNGGYGYNNGENGENNDDNNGGNGHRHHHHPNGNAYGYYGNGNHNGNGGNGSYGAYGGYGYNNLPGGSYQQSCTNDRMNGSTLSASCTAANGSLVNSSIDVRRCQSRDIANRNGYLSC